MNRLKDEADKRWELYMGTSDAKMLTEEESKAICPRCKRLQSLMENISYAWDHKDEVPDGYSRLKFSIELMESERIR